MLRAVPGVGGRDRRVCLAGCAVVMRKQLPADVERGAGEVLSFTPSGEGGAF